MKLNWNKVGLISFILGVIGLFTQIVTGSMHISYVSRSPLNFTPLSIVLIPAQNYLGAFASIVLIVFSLCFFLNGIITVSNEEKGIDEMRIYKFKAGLRLIFYAILLVVGGCNELLYRLITSQSMSGLFFRFDVHYGLEMMGFHFNAILFGLISGLTGLYYILPVIREYEPLSIEI